jgi:hypothetical protein
MINIKLLLHMMDAIDNCELTGTHTPCPGDSGAVACILCKKNILSTEEMIWKNWR